MLRGTLLGILACATPALAQPLPPAATVDDDGPFVFAAGHFGLNAPFGALGFEVGGGIDFLRGSLSVGRGLRGVSFAAMGRAVKDIGAVDLGLGVGVSRGPGYRFPSIDGEGNRASDSDYDLHFGKDTIWLDLEMSAEIALPGAGFMRVYAGVTDAQYVTCVAQHHYTDETTGCDGGEVFALEQDEFSPYIGMAIGARWPPAPASKPRYTAPQSPNPIFPLW